MDNQKKFKIKLEWTNQNEFDEHIRKLRKIHGDQLSIETVLNFEFEFNHGLGHLCKE